MLRVEPRLMRIAVVEISEVSHRAVKRERGGVLVLAAAFTAVAIILLALVVDVDKLGISKDQLQQMTNLGAQAALNEYLADPSSSLPARREAATVRAEEILHSNRFLGHGDGNDFGAISNQIDGRQAQRESGRIEFGDWFETDPDGPGGEDPCSSAYPCFRPIQTVTQGASAVRLVTNTPSDASVNGWLSGVFGSASFSLSGLSAVATSIPRCVAVALDVSESTLESSHNTRTSLAPTLGYSPYVFRRADFEQGRTTGLYANENGHTCDMYLGGSPPYGPLNVGAYQACWLWNESESGRRTRTAESNAPFEHYASDYDLLSSTGFRDITGTTPEEYYIDTYRDAVTQPEPLTSLLLAINAAATNFQLRANQNDSMMLIGFDHEQRPAYAASYPNFFRVTPLLPGGELGFIQQITNPQNMPVKTWNGTGYTDVQPVDETIHPNAIDFGLYPRPGGATDHWGTLEVAIDHMTGWFGNGCAPNAEKHIILITDGLSSCYRWGRWPGNPGIACGPTLGVGTYYNCLRQKTAYTAQQSNEIFCTETESGYHWVLDSMYSGASVASGRDVCVERPFRCPQYSPGRVDIHTELRTENIRLNVILVGDAVAPNLMNRVSGAWTAWENNGRQGPEPHKYLDVFELVQEARSLPLNQQADFVSFGRMTPTGQVQFGVSPRWVEKGTNGITFDHPNNFWVRNVLRGGGTFCPILQEPASGLCENDTSSNPFNSTGQRLQNSVRDSRIGQSEFLDPYCRSKGAQAADCITNILGVGTTIRLVGIP